MFVCDIILLLIKKKTVIPEMMRSRICGTLHWLAQSTQSFVFFSLFQLLTLPDYKAFIIMFIKKKKKREKRKENRNLTIYN